MFHLYCPTCDRSSPIPPETDAIILLCSTCQTRRELRSGPLPAPIVQSPPTSIQTTPLKSRFLSDELPLPQRDPSADPSKPLAEYPISPERIETYAGCGWMLLVAGGIAAVVAISAMYGTTNPGSAWVFVAALVGIVALIVGICLVGWARQNKNLCVRVFPDGLERTWGSETIRCNWNDIVDVYENVLRYYVNGIYTKTTHEYRLRLRNNEELFFDDQLQNVAQLGATVLRETFERKAPQSLEALEKGMLIQFGGLYIGPDGLVQHSFEKKEHLPWSEVNNVDYNTAAGTITISRKTGRYLTWWQGSIAGTPNALVMLHLLDNLVGVNRT